MGDYDVFLNTPSKDNNSISSARRLRTAANSMREVGLNSDNKELKISIFNDRNGDGKFDSKEVTSVKYLDPYSKSSNSVEYRDIDGDGFCDDVITADWMGETVTKVSDKEKFTLNNRMDYKYGLRWDQEGPATTK